jgi:hypothetical protein
MPDGRLYRSHKDGESKINGFLEDYAGVIDGLLELYQSDFQARWFIEAQRLADHVLVHFSAQDGGGFYDTGDDHEALIARPRSLQDNATPGGNNLMAYNLIRLGAYSGDPRYEAAALGVLRQVNAAAVPVGIWGGADGLPSADPAPGRGGDYRRNGGSPPVIGCGAKAFSPGGDYCPECRRWRTGGGSDAAGTPNPSRWCADGLCLPEFCLCHAR